MPLTGRPGLSMGVRASTLKLNLTNGGQASNREAGPLTERPGFSEEGWTSQREARPLTGRLGLSEGGWAFQGGCASDRKAGPLTGRLGLLQGGRASHRKAGLLTECYIT